MSYSKLNSWSDSVVTVRQTVVTISPGTDTLRDAVDAIDQNWCTENNPYRITMAVGTYNDIQIIGKHYVTIQGAGIDSTIIVTDGLREDVDPVSSVAYNLMAQADKHGIYGHYEMTFSGLTWQANDVKYCIHADGNSATAYDLLGTSCRFEHSNGYPVGLGCYGGQSHTFGSCQFEKTGANVANGTAGSHGIFWHNANIESAVAALTLTSCDFDNCGVLRCSEIDSGQTDAVTVTNCTTDDEGTAKGIYITASGSGLAYCINITQNGGTMPAFAFDAVNRPNAASYYTLNP